MKFDYQLHRLPQMLCFEQMIQPQRKKTTKTKKRQEYSIRKFAWAIPKTRAKPAPNPRQTRAKPAPPTLPLRTRRGIWDFCENP